MSMKTRMAAAGVCAMWGLAGHSALGQCEIEPLVGDTTAAFDSLGVSSGIDGDAIVVGAPGVDFSTGGAFVFRRQGAFWNQDGSLAADVPAEGDQFGASVAVSGDYAVVGAPMADGVGSGTGAAYVFHYDGAAWSFQAKLTADDGAAQDFFGQAVAISGDRVLVGAYGDDDAGDISGSAYVFVRSGTAWSQEMKLTADDAAMNDQFGWSVALSDVNAVVGANHDDDGGDDSGSVYVFDRSGSSWSQTKKLTADDAAAGDAFGQSVSISGDTIAVGAVLGDGLVADSGAAYVFRNGVMGWMQEMKLTADDGAGLDQFGWSVSIDGDLCVVGAKSDDDDGNRSGSAYAFERQAGVWSQTSKLTASNAAAEDMFGVSVGVSDGRAVVGAWLNNAAGENAGSAYAFVLTGADCNSNGEPDECDIASGFSTDVNNDGIPDSCAPPACACELTGNSTVDVFDLLAYLGAWFAMDPSAELDGSPGISVFDLLDYLSCWFPASAGNCP